MNYFIIIILFFGLVFKTYYFLENINLIIIVGIALDDC